MHRPLRALLAIALLAAGCAGTGTHRGERIGWFANHWVCNCPAPVAVVPPAEPTPPPPAPPAAPTVFVVAYRVAHPCLAHATKAAIDEAIAFMLAHPATHAVIDGHADPKEPRPEWLAHRRSLVVGRYMSQHGIAASRLITRSFAASRPVASSDTPEGRRQNRRVEIAISDR